MAPLHFLLAILVVFAWGFNFVVVKIGLEDIPPLLLCAERFFLTSIPLVFFVKFPATTLKLLFWYATTVFALNFVCLFLGMHAGVTPGLASMIKQSQVFFTILLAVVFMGEKLRPWNIGGVILAFSGIALAAVNMTGAMTKIGLLLVFAGGAFWGVGNIVSKKIGDVNMISLIVWGSMLAWPPLLAVSFLVEGPERIFHSLQNMSWQSAGAVAFIAFFATLYGYGAWSWLIHHYSLAKIVPFTLLVPFVSLATSVLFFNEPLEPWKVGACALVVSGLCINLLGPRLSAYGFFPRH